MGRAVLPLLLLSLAFAPAPFPKPDRRAGRADLKAMQGEWVLVRETHATGPPRPKRHLGASFKRGRVTFFPEGDGLAGEWAVTLAAGEQPKAIDLKKGGRLIRAVYSLKGDTLVVSWNATAEREAVRPVSFPGNLPVACHLTFKRKAP
jgi:uncharacterized protein (TIGR03067 family)